MNSDDKATLQERYDAQMTARGLIKCWFIQNGLACYSYERPIMAKWIAENEQSVKQAARNFVASKPKPKQEEDLPAPKKRKRGGW